jgi:hypothetical protein
MRCSNQSRRAGNTLLEFALVVGFLVPLLLGTVNVGMNLSRSIQVTQVSRDAGHMFARYVDFSLPGNQDLIVRLAAGLGMTRTGGNGKVILSKIMFVGETECAAGGLTLAQCTNYNQPVILQRIVIGNASLRASAFGEPNPALLDSQGNVANYLTDVSARAVGFQGLLALQPGEFAYVSEAFFQSPDYDFPGFSRNSSIYARTIF